MRAYFYECAQALMYFLPLVEIEDLRITIQQK